MQFSDVEIGTAFCKNLTGARTFFTTEAFLSLVFGGATNFMEIMAAFRSPDPTQFVSHHPVHQDGSCNGLRHYVALELDVYGAK